MAAEYIEKKNLSFIHVFLTNSSVVQQVEKMEESQQSNEPSSLQITSKCSAGHKEPQLRECWH